MIAKCFRKPDRTLSRKVASTDGGIFQRMQMLHALACACGGTTGARGNARRCADHDRRGARARRRVEPGAASFIEHDAFQCGYSTSGQPCCAAALVDAFAAGAASAATGDVRHRPVQLSDDKIRERMSGNLCRCGASPNIAAAVRAAHATTTFARGATRWKRSHANAQRMSHGAVRAAQRPLGARWPARWDDGVLASRYGPRGVRVFRATARYRANSGQVAPAISAAASQTTLHELTASSGGIASGVANSPR